MLKDLMNYTFKLQGKYIRNVLCEHFSYSRQELYDLIKVKELKFYDDVLDALGHGDGCEICKPAVASILASLWNEMILKKGNDTAQDSNDRYLANIQKGGTYSVVPRIPGGEITPEKLIVIGQIAKKYKLYSKGGLYLRDRLTHALGRLNPFNGRSASHGVESAAQSADSSAVCRRCFMLE